MLASRRKEPPPSSHPFNRVRDIALHFCREHEEVEAVVFWDPTPGNPVQGAVDYFLALPDVGRNRPIRRFSTEQWGIKFVNISWSTAAPLAGEEF
jgi:hypothetical protein